MKRPVFIEGVLLAVILGILGRAAYTGLQLFVPGRQALLSVITLLALCYLMYLLKRSRERTGRITVFSCWLILTAVLCISQPPVTAFILAQAAMLWLIRSLYFYTSVLSALVDLVFTALALAVVVWGGFYTNSLFFCIWTFFLIQALFVTIPPDWSRAKDEGNKTDNVDRFEQAYRCAEAAVRKLTSLNY